EDLAHGADDAGVGLLDDGEEQVFLGGEVVVDHADVRAGAARDGAQRGRVDAALEELVARGAHDALPDVRAWPGHQPSFFLKRSDVSSTSTPRMTASARTSGASSAKPAPLRTTPRMTRRKWVSGRPVDRTCAKRGMAANGNMNPDSRMLG